MSSINTATPGVEPTKCAWESIQLWDAEGNLLYCLETLGGLNGDNAEGSPPSMIGRSASFQRMLEMLRRAAPTETAVLLLWGIRYRKGVGGPGRA